MDKKHTDPANPGAGRKWIMELMVVFLGVTAGFLLNSWREQKQERSLEQKYLIRFLEDINNNIADLERSIAADSLWKVRAEPILLSMKDRTLPDTAKEPVRLMQKISRLDLQTTTYEDITNSGNLNLIRNFELKRELTRYQVSLEGIRFVEDSFYGYFNNFVMPFLLERYDLLGDSFIEKRTITTPQFSNIFAGYYSLVLQQETTYRQLLRKSMALRDLLTASLEK